MKMLRFFAILLLVSSVAPAQSVRETVEAFAKIGSATSPSLSPDGERVAFVSALSGTPQIWIMPSAGGFPEQITAFDDPVTGVRWSPDGKWLAFGLAPGGGLNSQVWLVRPNGTGLRRITDGGRTNNWLGEWLDDASAIAIASNRRDPAAVEPYLVDPDGNHTLIAKSDGIASIADASRDGRIILLYRLVTRGNDNLYLLDPGSGRETLLTPHEGPAEFSGVLSPDGRTVWLTTNATTDRAALGRIVVGEKGPGPIEIVISRDDAELDGIEIDPSGSKLALFWNAAGRSELALYDIASGRERKLTAPGEILFAPRFSNDGRYLTLNAGGAAAPIDVWIVDTQKNESRQLTRSPHPGIDLASLVRPELVEWKAHDGLPLSGWLYRPAGAREPGPLVLSFHGGPEGQERTNLRDVYQALLSQGISVLAPNVRGSSGFGKRFVNLDNGILRKDAVRDIRSTVEFAVSRGIADPKRIGIMGGSYGGYMVMAGLAEYPEMFGAGANLFGVVNFETFFAETEPWMAAISKVEYGDPDTEAEMLRELSPIHRVDRVVAPTIVLHGANDTNVPVVEAEQVVDSLKKRNVPVRYVLFPDEGHGWRKTVNRITSTVEIVEWFSKYLATPAAE
jgi:dipeptidyl aminopeptidase/acylaminoacyl peptidase